MRRATCLLTACLVLTGGATPAFAKKKPIPSATVGVTTDPFSPDLVVATLSTISIKAGFSTWASFFQAKYLYNKKAKTGAYVFDFYYVGSDWVLWDTLSIKVTAADVRRMSAVGQPRHNVEGTTVTEQVRFEVPADVFAFMTSMPRVDMRIGGKFYYDFFLNSEGTANLKILADKAKEFGPTEVVTATDSKPAAVAAPEADYTEELRKLAKLRDDSVITEEEFSAKKRQLLGLENATEGKPSETSAPQQQTPPPLD